MNDKEVFLFSTQIRSLNVVSRINKILCCIAALMSLYVFTGCGKDNEKTSTPTPSVSQHTLIYSAGANGSITGDSRQSVLHGGTGRTVSAVPAEGYHFESWSDGVTTPGRTDSDVTADLAVTATFAINQYTLSYTATEGGAIEEASEQTVKHGADGTPVDAVAAEHYHFEGWSDGVTTPQRTDRNVTADLSLTATFAIDQYSLTYAAGKNGTIEGEKSQTVAYGGAGATVTAKPVDGYRFVSWSDGLTTAKRTDSNVTGDLSVEASFSLNKYTLTYTAGKNGSIDGISPQTVIHGGDGTLVTAVPAEHYHFGGWSDGVGTASRIDRMVHGDISVTANFAIDQYTLSYDAGKNGTIKGTATQKIDYGGSGSPVTAVPAEGYHFLNWSDGVATAKRIDSKVTADFAVTANFALNQYTLTYTAGDHGTIEGVSPQTVNHGGDGSQVTAVAEKGYHFDSWSDGVTTAQRQDSKVKGDLTVKAVFAVNTYSIGGRLSGLVEGTQVVLQNNGGDGLELTTNGDFSFSSELLNAETYEVSVLTQPTSPNQTCTVTKSAGIVSEKDVTDVMVTCVLNTYTIGGTVSGLPDGNEVVLRNNDGDDLFVSVNGAFTFAKPLDDHSEYEVTVYKQPKRPNWKCTTENAAGALRGKDVTDVVIDCYPEAVLQAKTGIRKVKLQWNSQDFREVTSNHVTFKLCRAKESIPNDGFNNCTELAGGAIETNVDSPLTASSLTNDILYYFQLEVKAASGRRTLSKVVSATPFGGLNDTGIDWCSDDTINRNTAGTRGEKTESCEALADTHPGQDALHGRDAEARSRKLSKAGSGSAGLDFTKVCMSGEIAGEGSCPPNPTLGDGLKNWACTRDNVTGLTWEVKTTSGLHDQDNSYTWYNPDDSKNGGKPGVQNGGSCQGSGCDTQAFVQEINALGLCGANDWRLPTRKELLSILDNSRFDPAIDSHYFPNALSAHYWSSSPYSEKEDFAWEVYFKYGEADTNKKNESNRARLVRGRTVTFGLDNPK
jgi:hypothetical protein